MNIGDYFMMLVNAYNPNRYDKLVERPAKEYWRFFFVTLIIAITIFTILVIPFTFGFIRSIPHITAETEQLQLNANVQANHSVILLQRPQVVLDLQANATRNGVISLTNEGILYPKYMFFGNGIVQWKDIRDLKEPTKTRDHILRGVVIFLLPSIIFWFLLFSLFKVFLIALILFLLGGLIPRMLRHSIPWSHSAKIVILALPSLLILDLGLFPLAPLFWWGVLLTTVFFAIGVAIVSDRIIPEKEHKRGKI